jgi:hypothetical protein
VRRWLAVSVVGALLALAGCIDDEPAPEPSPSPEQDEAPEDALPSGLRVGVVLPPFDRAAADEIDTAQLAVEELDPQLRGEVAELRTVVPDASAFVADVATLLVTEGYDVVCVLGAGAADVAADLAERHAATQLCAAPAVADEDDADNLLVVDVALAELGHVVGAALGQLGDEDPVALLGTGNRAGGEAFRAGLRAGVGDTPLQEARGDLEQLEEELAEAVAAEVAAIAVDAGPDAADLLDGVDDVALLAPAPLLSEQDTGVLRWRVRWEVVLEAVIAHLVVDDAELPDELGIADEVFALDHGPQADDELLEVVGRVLGELERGERDPLEPPEEEDEEEDDGDTAGVNGPVPPE